ncbi:MAG: hypothetical protein RMM17_00655 [Acidobacteriota bacterium]|nr:hypothetical protein [Blastocatellia bacterium]MDW8411177.1 hypothetical protein [Acidobacteriota bacterium]
MDCELLFDRLLELCIAEQWRGYDPYDGLSSPICRYFPKYLRIAWTQFFKRSPINFRKLVGIKKQENPKALGLAARALLMVYRVTGKQHYRQQAEELLKRLYVLRSPGYGDYFCWGYSFAWQSRAFYLPARTPSIVCTAFVADAWLEHYEVCSEPSSLEIAISACEFLLKFLNYKISGDELCFSYTPLDNTQVHNANLLGAALLARTSRYVNCGSYVEFAVKSAMFSIRRQASDGSWPYGMAANQQWIDSFHTGFVLVSLADVITACQKAEWSSVLERGLRFYCRHFFLADGTPKYYHNSTYPIDIHSCAQALVTYARLSEYIPDAEAQLNRLLEWTLRHMYDKNKGYFYFQRRRLYINRIAYLRWSQAWMLYALAWVIYRLRS